ncbi:hypothetical protein I6A84_01305 [Frankia sp. CNm7]|uniref:Phage FDXHR zinc binding domain-containing protein n=1 Tax=Frankia nepalensis TaxID=1836974 RepID=A0A937RJZ8_9ACTN|nr:hypothetical protein [Frankia nepalensis]MBL7496105.1 hypothetical protein [Frankia nepalensis]MBL7508956.1 hypothetical protein [Frankia nepalensis]MBL7516796.1 hypothetical protein [Frankia nepalensis]MBL7628734.1 hypothetical protein [Frankia nepalensis]
MTTGRATPDLPDRRRRSGRDSGRAAGVQQTLPVPLRGLGQPGRGARHIPVTASCGGCDHRWTEEDATHCRGCHGHWPDLAGFDEHLAACPTYIPIEPPSRSRVRKAS